MCAYARIKYRRRNAGAVTPRQATVLLVFSLVTVLATAALPGVAQGQATAAHVRALSVNAGEDNGKGPKGAARCWDLQTRVLAPGDQVTVTVTLEGSAHPHDFHVVNGQTEIAKAP